MSGDNHALAVCSREPGVNQLDYLVDRETMREQDRLGTAIPAGGKQLERAAAVGLRATSTVWNGGSDATALVGHSPKR